MKACKTCWAFCLIACIGISILACERERVPELPVSPIALEPKVFEASASTTTPWKRFDDSPAHDYAIDLAAGEFLHLEIEQRDIDVYSSLAALDDEPVFATVDLPTGDQGPEPICFIAPASGRYRLRIEPWRPSSGRYRLIVMARRASHDRDAACEHALRSFLTGEQLQRGGRDAKLKALEHFRRASELWTGENVSFARSVALRREAQTLTVLGIDGDRVQDLLMEALATIRRTPYCPQEVNLLNDLGNHKRNLDLTSAAEFYEQAHKLAKSCGHSRGEATALANLALIDRDRGDYEQALGRYKSALQVWREQEDRRRQAEVFSQIGSLLMLLGEDRRAHEFLKQAIDIQRLLDDRRGEAESLLQIGWLLHLTGAEERGAVLLLRALASHRALGDRLGEAGTLDRLGTVYRHLERWQLAERSYRMALALLQQIGDQHHELYTEANLGLLYQARGWSDRAIEILVPVEQRLAALGNRTARGRVLLGLAQAQHHSEDFDRALENFAAALQVFQELREQPRNPRLRTEFLAVRQDYYELYIDFLFDLSRRFPDAGFARQGFHVHEQAQARTLLDLLNQSGVDWRGDVPPELLARETAILTALARKDENPESERHLERDPWQELLTLHEEMRTQSASFAALARPEIIDLETVQNELDPETALLSFRLGEQRSYLWVVRQRTVESFVLPPRQAIEDQARAFHQALIRSDQQRFRNQSRVHGAELYRLLFAAVPAERLDPQRWWIIADGGLHLVPFAALPAPHTGQPLLFEHEISMLPTASVWLALHKRRIERRAADRLLAVIADPVFSQHDSRSQPGMLRSALHLPTSSGSVDPLWPPSLRRRLQHSGEEAKNLLALAKDEPTLALLGFEARRDRILGEALSSYKIVHFATHSRVDASHPSGSSILLSAFDPSGQPIDDLLRSEEIYTLRWSADLVVLSACSTALGKQVRGEGLMSLSRAFMQGGASGVVVSLWNVLDASAAQLMQRFYRAYLSEGLTPPAALRQAQLEMLQTPAFKAPCSWAPFIFQGDPTF